MSALRNSGRRAFLRGVGGVTLGLPLLEYTHERAFAADAGHAKRFVNVFAHGGEAMCVYKDGGRGGSTRPSWDSPMPKIDHWLPKADWKFGVAHEVFRGTPIEQKMIVVRGVDNSICTNGRYGGDHSLSNCTSLTARPTRCLSGGDPEGGKCSPEESEFASGPSIDWVIAQRLQKRFGGPSSPLALHVPGHYYGSGFFWGANGEQRVEGEINPRAAFNALFSNVTSGEPDPAVVRARALKGSKLNSLMEGYRRFSKRLGTADKQIVDAHLDHLTELEREVSGVEVTAQCVVPEAPINDDNGYTTQQHLTAPALAKIIVAAMRCGLTHVADLQIADILTPWAPSGLQIDSDYGIGHALGHWVIDLGTDDLVRHWELEMKENRAWRMGLVKIIADGLDDPNFMEGDRTLLDNSLIFYSNEFSTGGIHSSTDGAYMLIGGAGGYLSTGRYIELHAKRRTNPASMEGGSTASTNNLFVSILNAFGEPDTAFGDMSVALRQGAISELRG